MRDDSPWLLSFLFFLQCKLWEMLCEQLHSPQWKRNRLYRGCYLVQLFTMKFNSEKGNEAVSFFVCVSFFCYYWICDEFLQTAKPEAGTSPLSAERGSVFSLTTPRLQVCQASLAVTQEVFCRMSRWQLCEFLHPGATAVKIWITSLHRSQLSSSHFLQ